MILSLSIFAFPANFRAEATTITVTKTFTSLSYDGEIRNSEQTYEETRNANEGVVIDDSTWATVGQSYYTTGGKTYYYVFRAFLYFDTSTIPDDAEIVSAILSLSLIHI